MNMNIRFPEKIDVTQYKSPTDESIRLLNEFQEKAKENIIHNIQIESTFYKAHSIVFKPELGYDKADIYIKFSINNKEFIAKKTFNHGTLRDLQMEIYNIDVPHVGHVLLRQLVEKELALILAKMFSDDDNFASQFLKTVTENKIF